MTATATDTAPPTVGRGGRALTPEQRIGWDLALREIAHQASHWAALEHSLEGRFIADSLLVAVETARAGGLPCSHRQRPTPSPAATAPSTASRGGKAGGRTRTTAASS